MTVPILQPVFQDCLKYLNINCLFSNPIYFTISQISWLIYFIQLSFFFNNYTLYVIITAKITIEHILQSFSKINSFHVSTEWSIGFRISKYRSILFRFLRRILHFHNIINRYNKNSISFIAPNEVLSLLIPFGPVCCIQMGLFHLYPITYTCYSLTYYQLLLRYNWSLWNYYK